MNFWTRLFGKAPAPPPASPPDSPARNVLRGEDARVQTIWLEPSVRAYPTWTPTTVKSAELAADGGNLRLAGDLCEWILKDDRVSADMGTRVRAITGAEVSFEGSGDGRRRSRALKALDAEEDWYATFPENELTQLLIWGWVLGISHGQKLWTDRGKSGRLAPRLNSWYPRHLTFNWNERQWYTRVDSANSSSSGATGSPGYTQVPISNRDRYWILHTPYGANRPWVHGLWRVLSRWCLVKDFAVRDIALMGEVHGMPTKVIKQTAGSSQAYGVDPKLRKQLSDDLSQMARNGYIALPTGFDLELLEATANTWQMYQAQINLANSAISIAILGQEMTSAPKENQNGVTGAREVRQDLAEADEKATTTLTHDQFLEDWAEVNYGDRALAPWPHWRVEATEDLTKTAATWNTVAQTLDTLLRNGRDLDDKVLAERFKMPLVKVDPTLPAASVPLKKDGDGEREQEQQARQEPGALARRGDVHGHAHAEIQGAAKPLPDDDGQKYADAVCEKMQAHAAKSLAPTIAKLMTAVHKAKTYEEAQRLVAEAYGKMRTPVELAQLTEAALIMTELGGTLSAVEHVNEID